MEMFFCCVRLPPGTLDKTTDELFLATDEIDHSALIVANECNAANITDRDSIGDLELTIPQICTTSTNNECEIVRNMKVLRLSIHIPTNNSALV